MGSVWIWIRSIESFARLFDFSRISAPNIHLKTFSSNAGVVLILLCLCLGLIQPDALSVA